MRMTYVSAVVYVIIRLNSALKHALTKQLKSLFLLGLKLQPVACTLPHCTPLKGGYYNSIAYYTSC
jgi:hypothetical protein